jgi:GntR family transcriptional regulator
MAGVNPTSTASASAPGPLRYRWLADVLREAIEGGKFADNGALPAERDLAEIYKVSRDTVRKAVRSLEEQGFLYSEHGRGTFVAPAILRAMPNLLDSFSVDTEARGAIAGQRMLAIDSTTASMGIAGLLGLQPGHPLIQVRRIRTVNDQPVGLQDAYLPAINGLKIEQEALEKAGSLYKLLSTEFGIIPAEAIEHLNAAAAEVDDASLLNVAPGSPLLICERITLSERRVPIEYCLMKYVPSYRYRARINKRSAVDWSSFR